jgi:hypothetical protein
MIKFICDANRGMKLALRGVQTAVVLIMRCSSQFLRDDPHWGNYLWQLNSEASAKAPYMLQHVGSVESLIQHIVTILWNVTLDEFWIDVEFIWLSDPAHYYVLQVTVTHTHTHTGVRSRFFIAVAW